LRIVEKLEIWNAELTTVYIYPFSWYDTEIATKKEFAKHFDSGILHRSTSNGVLYEEMGKNMCLMISLRKLECRAMK